MCRRRPQQCHRPPRPRETPRCSVQKVTGRSSLQWGLQKLWACEKPLRRGATEEQRETGLLGWPSPAESGDHRATAGKLPTWKLQLGSGRGFGARLETRTPGFDAPTCCTITRAGAATEAKTMTRGRRRARKAEGWRAQVRGTPSPSPKAGLALRPTRGPLSLRSSVWARQRAPAAREGAGPGTREGPPRSRGRSAESAAKGRGSDGWRGIRIRASDAQWSRFPGLERSGSECFSDVGAAGMPSPQTLPSSSFHPSVVQPGGGGGAGGCCS